MFTVVSGDILVTVSVLSLERTINSSLYAIQTFKLLGIDCLLTENQADSCSNKMQIEGHSRTAKVKIA